MHGLSGTGGIRYQFNSTDVASAMPVKAKVPLPGGLPVNWTDAAHRRGQDGLNYKFWP
jgi:hypothetical protein